MASAAWDAWGDGKGCVASRNETHASVSVLRSINDQPSGKVASRCCGLGAPLGKHVIVRPRIVDRVAAVLLATTCLTPLLVVVAPPARADGGNGGDTQNSGVGGTGGTGFTGQDGGNGTAGTPSSGGGGGGAAGAGGGAGTGTGGSGGGPGGQTGGAGGGTG